MNNNENGFVTVSLAFLGPVLAITIFMIAVLCQLVWTKQTNYLKCQQANLSLQKEQGRALNNLLSKNPQAKSLRAKRKVAETIAKAARQTKNPKLIIPAEAALLAVKTKQALLRAEQQRVLTQASLKWKVGIQKIRLKFMANGQYKTLKTNHTLPVLPKGSSTGSPTYHPAPKFQSLQASYGKWHSRLPKNLNVWTTKIMDQPVQLSGQCAATLKKKGQKWKPVLTTVRFA